MLRSLVSGISTATVVGVSSGMVGSMIWGTAGLPFLIGSSLGFAFGSYRWYEVATREAMVQLDLYPALLQLHITSNFPWVPDLHSRKRDWYTAETFRRSWVMKSMLVVGWLSAESSLREIRERREARLVEEYVAAEEESESPQYPMNDSQLQSMASIAPAAKLAVLIDADNASAAMIAFVLAEFAKYGTTFVKRAYGDWTSNRLNGWKPQLLHNSIHPMQQFAYTYGKNATDSAMIIDAMDLLYSNKFDGFCIVSSDSDFTRLASRIRESGLMVYGCGERKTPKPFVTACDKFIYVENLVPRSGTPSIEVDVAGPSTAIPLNGVSSSERPPRGHASISAFSKGKGLLMDSSAPKRGLTTEQPSPGPSSRVQIARLPERIDFQKDRTEPQARSNGETSAGPPSAQNMKAETSDAAPYIPAWNSTSNGKRKRLDSEANSPAPNKPRVTSPEPGELQPEQRPVDDQVIEWLREAVEVRTGEDGWAGLAPVGMLMNRWHPDFDVRTYGFKKLHELMASTGLFEFMDQRPGEGKPIVKYARYLTDRDDGGSVDSRPTGIVSSDS
ncbi:OST-HTH/LOTUS domain [Fusarium oxysporum f. sp. vasinfectum]|nr:OST-HTH/LOTUS domain [Fusarium oxysporum f. sp. vasinfectum]